MGRYGADLTFLRPFSTFRAHTVTASFQSSCVGDFAAADAAVAARAAEPPGKGLPAVPPFPAAAYNDFDMFFGPGSHFLTYHQRFTTQHMLCAVICLAPTLIGC